MELTLNARPVSAVSDDVRLVAAARAGDDRAFEQLYCRYRERILGFILSKLRDHGRAEDIAQDVFMSALRQLRASDQEIAFKPWLYTIARNACIDEFRRGSRGTEIPVDSDAGLDAGALRRPLLSVVPTPTAAVESKQQLDDLRGAFTGLTESQHQLLVMREFEGLSYDEIGGRLGMTKQMVESGLFRARRKLTEEYDELASGRRCEEIQDAIDAGRLVSAKAIGIKDRRRYTRHLSHCQPCRHVAQMACVDAALLKPRRLVDKVAALLPFPLLRRLLGHGGHGAAHAGTAQAAAQVAGTAGAGAGAASVGLGQAASVAVLALAGTGGGLLATHAIGTHHHAAPAAHHVIARPASVRSEHAIPVVQGSVVRSSASAPRHSVHAAAVTTTAHHAVAKAAPAAGGPAVAGAQAVAGQTGGQETAPVIHAPSHSSGGSTPVGSGSGSGGSGSGSAGSGSGSGSGSAGSGASGSGGGSGSGSGSSGGSGSGGGSAPVGTTTTSTTSTTPITTDPVASAPAAVGSTVSTTASGVGTTVGSTASGVGTAVGATTSGLGSTVTGVTSTVGSTVSSIPMVGSTAGSTVTGVGSAVGSTVSSLGSTVGGLLGAGGSAAQASTGS